MTGKACPPGMGGKKMGSGGGKAGAPKPPKVPSGKKGY